MLTISQDLSDFFLSKMRGVLEKRFYKHYALYSSLAIFDNFKCYNPSVSRFKVIYSHIQETDI